jgi:hypothetical protein
MQPNGRLAVIDQVRWNDDWHGPPNASGNQLAEVMLA